MGNVVNQSINISDGSKTTSGRWADSRNHCFRIPSFYKTKCVFPPGATALIVAAKEGHLDIVRFLVEADAAKDQADNTGATALILAAKEGMDIVRSLVEADAAKDQADNTGVRAMFMAAQNGLLVEANAAKD